MKYCKLLILISTFFLISFLVYSNKSNENLEIDKANFFYQLCWKKELSAEDKDFLHKYFTSNPNEIKYEPYILIGVFQLEKFLSIIPSDKIATNFNQDFLNKLEDKIGMDESSFDKFLFNHIDINKLIKNNRHKLHYSSLDDQLLKILLIRQSKLLRSGKKVNVSIPVKYLTKSQQKLLEYSHLPNKIAIENLCRSLSKSSTSLMKKEELFWILKSYGRQSVLSSIETLKDASINDVSAAFFIENLLFNSNLIETKEKKFLREYIQNIDKKSLLFTNNRINLIRLEGVLNNEKLDVTIEKINNIRDHEAEKRLDDSLQNFYRKKWKVDSIINNHPANVISASNKRTLPKAPEEMGEDYSKFTKQELFLKLKTSTNRIEHRKIAIVLGNRFIEGNMDLTTSEKNQINEKISSYINSFPTAKYNERGEAWQQIRRYWHLAIPSLLKGLDSDNNRKNAFAAQALLEMRNEEIITKIIQKAEATSDLKKKKFFIQILKRMKEPYIISVKNRECMDVSSSTEIYNRIIAPTLDRLKDG